MRNLVASSYARWRVPLAPDPESPDGALETVVAHCHDADAGVAYVVTSACNLYGVETRIGSGKCVLEMTLVTPPRSSSDADADAIDAEPPALPRRADCVAAEHVVELGGLCLAMASGELLVVAPEDGDGDDAIDARSTPWATECVGEVRSGLRAMRWCPDGEILALVTGANTIVCMTKDFFVLAEAPIGGGCGGGGGGGGETASHTTPFAL